MHPPSARSVARWHSWESESVTGDRLSHRARYFNNCLYIPDYIGVTVPARAASALPASPARRDGGESGPGKFPRLRPPTPERRLQPAPAAPGGRRHHSDAPDGAPVGVDPDQPGSAMTQIANSPDRAWAWNAVFRSGRTHLQARTLCYRGRGAVPPEEGPQLTEQITVSVDSEVAEIYRSASDDVRRKLEVLVNLRLRDAALSQRPLRDVIREVSRNARRRGLTPEVLQSILDEA